MSELSTLLPPNATPHEQAIEVAAAASVESIANPFYTLWNPLTCPEHILPWLAWAFSVEKWDSAWPEQVKRQTIMASATIHRLKGTIGAVRRALETLGYEINVSEWFEYGGTPHTFRIAVDVLGSQSIGVEISADLLEEISDVIRNVKPERSHFDVTLTLSIDTPAYVGAFATSFLTATAAYRLDPPPLKVVTSPRAAMAFTQIRSVAANRNEVPEPALATTQRATWAFTQLKSIVTAA